MIKISMNVTGKTPAPCTGPIIHPYWGKSVGDDLWRVITYADSVNYANRLWPNHTSISVIAENIDEYEYSEEYPCPTWFHFEDED